MYIYIPQMFAEGGRNRSEGSQQPAPLLQYPWRVEVLHHRLRYLSSACSNVNESEHLKHLCATYTHTWKSYSFVLP